MRKEAGLGADPLQLVERFRVTIGGRELDLDLAADVRLGTDPEGLGQALADTPGKYAWWATLEAEARAIAETAEHELEGKWAELYAVYGRADREGKRPSVEAVKAMVQRDRDYRDLLAASERANRQLGLISAGKRSMEHRKEALLAIASNYRAELDAHQRNAIKTSLGTIYDTERKGR